VEVGAADERVGGLAEGIGCDGVLAGCDRVGEGARGEEQVAGARCGRRVTGLEPAARWDCPVVVGDIGERLATP
jgi:hypothetical protein